MLHKPGQALTSLKLYLTLPSIRKGLKQISVVNPLSLFFTLDSRNKCSKETIMDSMQKVVSQVKYIPESHFTLQIKVE